MIKAVVRYTAEHRLALDAAFGTKRKKALVRRIIIDIFDLAYLITAMYLMLFKFPGNNDIFVAIIIVFIFLHFKSSIKIYSYRSKLAKSAPDKRLCTFEFDEDEFFMRSEKENYCLKLHIMYPQLISAHETDDFFFIGTTPNKYAIIGKKEFTEGTPDELRQLLIDKLGDRFKSQRSTII